MVSHVSHRESSARQRSGVCPAAHLHPLTVPVHERVPDSLARLREVLTVLDASFGEDASLSRITAPVGSELRSVTVMPDATSKDRTTDQPTKLIVICTFGEGDAEALCRDIQHRYESQ